MRKRPQELPGLPPGKRGLGVQGLLQLCWLWWQAGSFVSTYHFHLGCSGPQRLLLALLTSLGPTWDKVLSPGARLADLS